MNDLLIGFAIGCFSMLVLGLLFIVVDSPSYHRLWQSNCAQRELLMSWYRALEDGPEHLSADAAYSLLARTETMLKRAP